MTFRPNVAVATGLALALLGGEARAQSVESASAKIIELDGQLADLDRRLKPPDAQKGMLAERRLVDAEVAYQLKNYEVASTLLYDLIEKYPTSKVYPEALYFLADSLYLKRDYFSSRRYFEKLVELGPSADKYQDALQRLVELSLHTGDYGPVDGYLAKLAQLPAATQLPSVPYVAGKYRYFRRQFDQAVTTMRTLQPGHKYYVHGLYFVAAAYVAMGKDHLADALAVFDTIIKLEPPETKVETTKPDPKKSDKNAQAKPDAGPPALTASQTLIVELAHLGRARILLEQGQLTAAIDEYARVKVASPNFVDALYESAWASIKGKEYERAAHKLELLLLRDPRSTLAPETRLLSGNLYIRQSLFSDATKSFIQARDEYEPISKQLKAELERTGDAAAYFREAIAKNMPRFDTAKVIPALAAKWMKDEQDVKRATELLGDEGDLDLSLNDADDTIKKLERAVNGPGRVNIFPDLARAKNKGVGISNELTDVKKVLSEREKQLIDPVAGPEAAQWKSLQDERAALEERLRLLPSKEDAIVARQEKARAVFNEIDKRRAELQAELTSARAQSVATKKYFHDAVEKTIPAERQAAATQELDQFHADLEAQQAQLDALRKEIEDASQNVGTDDSDMKAAEALKAQYNEALARQRALVQRLASRLGASERAQVDQIEGALDRARALEDKLVTYSGKVDALAEEQLVPIRAAINEEKAKVSGYHATLGGYTDESKEAGAGVLAYGLRAVTDRFYNIVIRSDVGIIDVAWALKDQASKETSRLISERKRELKLLDDEFKEVLKERP